MTYRAWLIRRIAQAEDHGWSALARVLRLQ
jgi:hypothetical protein